MKRLYLAVCESHADEYRAAVSAEHLEQVEIVSFSSACMRMKNTSETLFNLADDANIESANLIIIGGKQCEIWTSILAKYPGAQQVTLENCFYSYCSRWFIDRLIRDGSYIVTSGWLSSWRSNIPGWGFDETGIKGYFGEFSKLITVLDTGIDLETPNRAAEFGEYVGLPINRVIIDLEYLGLFLKTIVFQWRLKLEQKTAEETSKSYVANAKQIADFAMMFDVVSKIAEVSNEMELIQKLLDTFTMLFAPKKIGYYGIGRNFPAENISEENFELVLELIRVKDQRWCFTSSSSGFLLLIEHKQEVFGVLEVDGFAFQEYQSHYLNSILNIISVCGLAIANARQYEYVLAANDHLLYASTHDQLTGLYNRHFYELQINEIIGSDLQAVGIFVCDIDGLKVINDSLGHAVGDELIKISASILKNIFRDEDVIVRLGGDEFAVIVRNCTPELGEVLLGRIKTAIELRKQGGSRNADINEPIDCGLSVGFALANAPFEDLEKTFAEADDLMYLAKKSAKTNKEV